MSQTSKKSTDVLKRGYKVIEPGDTIRLKTKRIPYKTIASLLLNGDEVFIVCERRKASYIRRRLENLVGELIETYPCIYNESIEGYSFRISAIQHMIDKSNPSP